MAIFTTWDLDVELVGSQSPRCPEASKTLHVAFDRVDAAWAEFASPAAPSTKMSLAEFEGVLRQELLVTASEDQVHAPRGLVDCVVPESGWWCKVGGYGVGFRRVF